MQITFDPDIISYKELLNVFWRNINPADSEGQFVDRGPQYRPAIFYHNEEQKIQTEKSLEALESEGEFQSPVKVEIVALDTFYPAEEYHQNYYLKNPTRYKAYRYNSGRDQFFQKIWSDKTNA